jgi:hypothetical protein
MNLVLFILVPVFIISLINVLRKNKVNFRTWLTILIITGLFLLLWVTIYLVVLKFYQH